VLIIQMTWIYETAKIKEELFNEKAILVLSKTTEALATDKETCRNLEFCASRSDTRKVDSIINHYMKVYNIHISYYFDVKPTPVSIPPATTTTTSAAAKTSSSNTNNYFIDQPQQAGCYKACVGQVSPSQNGLELKLVFPDLEQFIMEEMGTLFITSVVLILVVIVLSWRTIMALMKEKQISEHTTDFLNNMTHEFKTPLTNIALAGKMMIKESNIRQEEKVKHYSGIILEENEKLRLQVEHVLSMTALERGEIPLRKTELDLHQLIHDCLKCIGVQIENKQGILKLKLDATKSLVLGDKTHLTNAVCNLIDNAIKYSVERPELSIQTSNIGASLVLVVSDNGIGIDDAYHKKVFDKFFRVPTGDVHDVKGFGLGLTYLKGIIELHGGTIALESEKGEGTTFTITLPNV
jgi:two-component system phosphate regulon sensor histidine kinase PhoR